MAKKLSKGTLRFIIVAAALAVIGFIGFRYWTAKKTALPNGIVSGNGRL